MPTQESQQRKIYIILLVLTALVLAVTFIIIVLNKKNETNHNSDKKDEKVRTDSNTAKDIVATALENNPKLKQSSDALLLKDYQRALILAEEVFRTTTDVGEKSMAEFNIASSYVGLKNVPEAAKAFYSIYSNLEYARTTRAAALNTLMQQYNGTKNKDFLKPVVENPNTLNDNQLRDIVYQKIYDVHPLGMASSHVGIMRLSSISSKDVEPAKMFYQQFLNEIDSDIDFQASGVGSAHIVPNIMMAKAKFMIFAYNKFKITSVDEISSVYEKAANLSRANNYKITEQFVYLYYINFLSLEKEFVKAEQVFGIFSAESPQEMVLQNLKQGPLAQNWPGLYLMSKQSSKVKAYFDLYQIKY